MFKGRRYARINVKVLVILIIITAAIVFSLFGARQIRRNILSKISLEAGQEAFDNKDWVKAYKNFQEYLGRNPDDVEIIKKYAESRLYVKPLEIEDVSAVIGAYRKVLQLDPLDSDAYEKLAMLYGGIGNYDELAYIAGKRLGNNPTDKDAPLWLAEAQINVNKFEDAYKTLQQFAKSLESLSDKYPQYIKACLMLANVEQNLDDTYEAVSKALDWYNKAVNYSPDSAEALVNRARFYRETSSIPGISNDERLSLIQNDLEAADILKTQNPQVLFLLCTQWLAIAQYDKAAEEIQVVDGLSEETIREYYLDIQDFQTVRYLLASDIALRRGDIDEAVSLIDKSLSMFKEEKNRMQFIPSAIKIYALAGKIEDANSYLDEYIDNTYQLSNTAQVETQKLYLQSLVTIAKGKPYEVVEILQPVIASNRTPELWRLLADAYGQIEQYRMSNTCIKNYLNFYPNDKEIIKLLAKNHFSLGQWDKANEAAMKAISLNSDDIVAKLIYIESGVRSAIADMSNPDKSSLEKFALELNDLRQKYPENAQIPMLKAVIANYLGQTDEAEKVLMQAILDCNDTLNAEMQLANLYRNTKRSVDATETLKKSTEKHSDSARPWIGLSEIYLEDSNVELARNCLKEGLDSVSSQENKRIISINLGLLELLYGQRSDGIEILKEIAAQDKQEINVHLMLLEIQEIRQDPKQTQEIINGLKNIEGQAGVWWRLIQAQIWLESEQWRANEKNISDFIQYCINADPDWSAPVLLMVDLYKKQGDMRRAEDICKQALAKNPLASDIANKLLLMLEEQGRFSDAENILQQYGVNQQLSNSWQIRMALNTGDIEKAINELKLRVDNNKKDINSAVNLARLVYQQTKDIEQAYKYLDDPNLPDSVNIPATKADILRIEGRKDEAIEIINDYVATHDTFNAYRMRAVYLSNEGEDELAEKDYRKLTTFESNAIAGYALLSYFYAQKQQYDKAISSLEEGLVLHPENTSLGRSLMRLLAVDGPTKDIQRANEILAKLEEQFPMDSELKKFKAVLRMENPELGPIDIAKESLEKFIQLEPTDVDSYLILISIALQEGKFEAARNYALQGLAVNTDNPVLMVVRSKIEFEAGKLQMAADMVNRVLQKYPNNKDARDMLVRISLKSRDKNLLSQAEKYIDSALEISPKDENLIITKANLLMVMERVDIAISGMETYCKEEPGNGSVPAIMTLAELYRVSGDIEKAEKTIALAENIEPDNLSIKHSRFLIYLSQKQYDKLTEMLDLYLSARKSDVRVVLDAATVLISTNSQDMQDNGLKLFEYAYTIAPDLRDAGFSLASALYRTGKVERAELIYNELLGKFPNDVHVLNDYAWILQEKHQDYDKALELANNALQLAPDDIHILDTRGTILLKSGKQLQQARSDFNKIVELTPANSRQQAKSFLNMGRISKMLNDDVETKRCYQRAWEINQKIKVFTPEEVTEIQENI